MIRYDPIASAFTAFSLIAFTTNISEFIYAPTFFDNTIYMYAGSSNIARRILDSYPGLIRGSYPAWGPGTGLDATGQRKLMATYNGSLYFYSYKLQKLIPAAPTATLASSVQISDTNSANDNLLGMKVYNNSLHFIALNSAGYYKLFKYNGTTITQISNINNNANDFKLPSYNGQQAVMTVHNGKLYFIGRDSADHNVLYSYDGTTVSLIPTPVYMHIYQIPCVGETGVILLGLYSHGNYLIMKGEDGAVYYYNGSVTKRLAISNTSRTWAITYNGKLYINLLNSNNKDKLYRIDNL